MLTKPEKECDGIDLHLRMLWKHNNAKSIFMITGLSFGDILTEPTTSPLDYLIQK